ncbi:MBL fold metallo-hydrolase [Rubrivivax gelatinosus]|uniref:Metallo-beta-lactamase domain-containing protein n=1 Tax=Rubrivivax gelatinosus TaxID=28068 RepID=A0ABS1DY52_RUBGE|nr:MBL fold metallo-hydrolase [Rubrivivax gelatinosus]MBK1714674.1 hypothetical protein [Rubrivivax gelatinosus]
MSQHLDVAQVFAQLRLRVFERGWLSSNNILFGATRDSPATVVDTGYDSHSDQTLVLLEQALAREPLERVINTHLHSDHCGGNASIQRRWAPEICVHDASFDAVRHWDEQRLSYRATGQRCDAFGVDRGVGSGESICLGGYDWRLWSAGGHDPDAMVLFQRESGVAITGDALWQDRVAIIFPELAGADGFSEAVAALDLIERLAPRVVIPGHGAPFTGVAPAVRQSRERLESFMRTPLRHLDYAERALLMFHMLEHRERDIAQLRDWLATTPVFASVITQRDRGSSDALENADRVIASLVTGGQLLRDGGLIKLAR